MRKHYVGIDIGCTNIKFVSKIGDEMFYPTSYVSSSDFTKDNLLFTIENYVTEYHSHSSLDGIGIAFSGLTSNGTEVTKSTIPCLKDFSINDLAHLPCDINSIRLLNDSNAATLAGLIEHPDSKVLVGVTNGTAIGCGVAVEGKLFTGSSGFLGEIYGNYVVTENGKLEKLGRIISGSKLLDKKTYENERVVSYISSLLSQIVNFYNPDVIYFSGGGFEHHLLELHKSIGFVKSHAYPHLIRNLKFELSGYGAYSGAIGAISYVS